MDFVNLLPSNHFLAQPRPDPLQPQPVGLVDTTTLAAHDFDVDNRTGFMPPQPPLQRLSQAWDAWESKLDDAVSQRFQLAERVELQGVEERRIEALKSQMWRDSVKNMPLLPTTELKRCERMLRRAHHVLCWLLHFYIQTIPSIEPITVPRALAIPLLQVSTQLQLPPILTYSDDVLYNWTHKQESRISFPSLRGVDTPPPAPALDNLRCHTTFTGTTDEEEFYLASARIELRGSEALELMRLTMDEIFVGDDIAIRRITNYLERMTVIIGELRVLLLQVKEKVDPGLFYNQIRPWFRGADGDPWGRSWVFEGKDEVDGLAELDELSGASAGQSSLIQALDIFLGVESEARLTSSAPGHPEAKSFQERMRAYMPRHHRAFLNHLEANPRPLRALVKKAAEEQEEVEEGLMLRRAYNGAVKALKEFRDAHMILVALYVIGPARRSEKRVGFHVGKMLDEDEGAMVERAFGPQNEVLKGTGGTDLVRFLKQVRDQTAHAYLQQ